MKKNIFIITCLLLIQLVIAQSPGGVAGASQWYNNTGASATQWTDSSGNNNNVPVSTAPSFTNSINFNTVSTFNGSSYYRRTTAGTNLPTSTSGSTYFYVAKTNSSATNEREVLGARGYYYNDGFNSGQYNNTNLYAGSYYGGYSQDANITNTWSLGNSKLVRAGYSNGTNNNRYISQNGSAETVSGTSSSISFASNNFSIGATYNGDRQWIGDIAEIIVYPSKLVQSNYDKVESYLAIKYGITKAGNYVASDGTVVYNDATYNKNIIALARDDNSLLHQRISKSQDASVDVLTASTNNNVTGLNSSTNQTNIASDNSFMFFANNGAAVDLVTTSMPTNYSKRVLRQWKVTKSANFTQTVFLSFPGFSSNTEVVWYLVKRNGNSDLSTGVTQVVALDANGRTNTAVTLNDGDYFTIMSTIVDSDGDTVVDLSDFDDDNDGITDDAECGTYTRYWSGAPTITGTNTARGVAGSVGYTYTSSTSVQTTGNIFGFGNFPVSYGLVNQECIQNLAANTNTVTFDQPVVNPIFMFASIGNPGLFVNIDFQYPIVVQWSQNVTQGSSTQITGNEGYAVIVVPGIYTSVTFSYANAESYVNFQFGYSVRDFCDSDGDGVANIVDLDSDNDGCPDYIEGSGSYTTSNGVTAGGTLTDGNGNAITQNLGNTVNAQGMPTVAGSGQTAGTSQNVNAVGCYAPGGVFSDFIVWYKADSSVYSNAGTTLATNGTTVQQWDDHSGSGYNLSQATAGDRPVYYSTTSNKLVNFNPSIEYVSTDRLVNANRLMPISSAHSFFGVAIDQATATGYKMIFSCDNSDDQFELYKQAGSTNTNGWMSRRSGNDYRLVNGLNNNNVIGGNGFSASGGSNGFWNGTNYSENLGVQPQVFGLLGNGTAAGSGVFFVDGYKATNISSVGTPANWFGRFSVGARTGGGNPFIGRIPEIIAYNRQLTDTEVQKINSYLAIKYGTTLGQGGVNIVNNNGNNYNYLNSDGNIVWNASTNSTYKYHIAGIGRDDASALNQKQSQSQNATETNQVIFGLGSVAATNIANANTFTSDKQFLLWGDNGASGPVAFSDTVDATIFSRLARTWFVDNTNSYSQNTQLLIPVALTTGGTSPKLVMNTSSAFASGTNTYIPLSATTTINSVSYYVVNLTAAQVANDFYFTVATNQKAPGGVATGLQLWMKANDGWSTTNWVDRSSNGFIATRVGTPTQTKRVNFHPTVSFTPGNYYNIPHNTLLNQNAQNQITVAAVFTTTPRTYNSFMAKTVNANWDNGWQLATEDNTSTNRLGFNTGDWSGGAPGYAAFQNIPILNPAIAFGYSTGNTGFANFISISGKVATQSTANVNTQISTSDLRIGDAGGYGYEGDLSEALMYNQNNASEKARIDSCLAIKYGITLDQTTPNNYVNSSGTIIWDATSNSGFKNDIAGIVRDDFSTLNQVMSKSVNSNAEPILSLSTIPVTNLNDTHAATNIFENNNQSLVWGNNAVRGFTSFTDPIDTNITHRLSRVWKAQTTNYDITGNDDIVFNFTKGSLQSFINSGSNYYLILSTTPDFSSNNYFVQLPTSFSNIDGTDYISSIYDVSSNAFSGITSNGTFYFTVAGKGTGPGGVLGIFWNRADKDVVTSGSNVSKWTDQTFGIESTQVRANTNVPTLGANISLFNFNPYLDFTNSNQSLGNEFVAPTEGFAGHIEQFFVTKDNAYSGRLFGINYDLKLSASGGNRYDWNAFESAFYRSRAASASGATATTNFSPALSTSLQNLSHLVSNASSNLFGYRYDGSTIASTTNASYNYIGQGGFVYGANNQGGIGGDDAGVTAQIAEHLIVGEALTATERRQVESYLAVKYGITISDLTSDASYRDASGNATFTTDATYKYDIFGIAKEATAGIDQRISRSINNDAANATNIITVSTDTNYTNMNLTHTDGLSDGQYLIFASNNGAVAFSGGSAITATDETVFSATEVLATRWKVQDKGGVGCVNMRFNNAAFTAVTGTTKYYMIVADDAAFTQNVTYKEVTRDASNNIDVTVNFGDNTNGSATTGNYFTIARKSLGITPTNLATVYTGVNTIGTSPNWKPTQQNTYLEINSNEKGVIVTRVADVTVATIASPIEGMMVFDLSDNKFKVYTGTSWRTLGLSEGVSATFCN